MKKWDKKPHEYANYHRILVERFLRELTKQMLDGENIENEDWGDLIVRSRIVEIKQLSLNNDGMRIRASQLRSHLNEGNDWPFEIEGSYFVLYRYHNRDTHGPKPGQKRRTHLSKCRDDQTTANVMNAHLRDCFFIHPLFLEALLKDQGLVERNSVNFGHPTLILSGRSVLEPLKSDDLCPLLKRLHLKSSRWSHIKTYVSIPFKFNSKEGDTLLPLTFNVPIYEIVPTSFEPLSRFIVSDFITTQT